MKHTHSPRKALAFFLALALLATLCACARPGGVSPAVSPSPTPTATPVSPSPDSSSPRALTDAELAQLTGAFDPHSANQELISFLTCAYSKPSEIDPNQVFYNGAGGFVTATDDQKDYLAANGFNMPANWRDATYPDGTLDDMGAVLLAKSTIDDILQRRLGITLDQVEKQFDSASMEWVAAYNAYFARRTDANVTQVQFVSGQFLGNDTYAADYTTDWIGNLEAGTYRVSFMMTNNDTNTIRFISNGKAG